ncbi:MAG: CoA transferase [Chloroflexota bacterium]
MTRYPLEGYRVADFGWIWAGAALGHYLADMGAEVIRIESRKKLDGLRMGRPIPGRDIAKGDKGEEPEVQPTFHCINRSKMGITMDMNDSEATPFLKRLVSLSDIVVENYNPRVMKKAGLDYESLRAIKPDIVMISLPSAGQYGPRRDIITYGSSVAAISGLSSLVGYADKEVLGIGQITYPDPTSATFGLIAVLMAIYHRNRTGEGQHIDLAQWETTSGLLGEAIMDYTMNGRVMGTHGTRHPTMVPHNNYPAQGEDKWVSIAVKTDEEWQDLCRAMGKPAWCKEERFADKFSRQRNVEELDKLIAAWTKDYEPYALTELLQKFGVAAMPVMNIEDQYFNPHLQERQVYIEVEHPMVGPETLYNLAWKLSDTPGGVKGPAHMLGQHNDYVFKELMGLPEEQVDDLVVRKVMH